MDFRICIIFATIGLGFAQQCLVQFESEECQYNMVCIDKLQYNQGWGLFKRNSFNAQYYPQYDSGKECSGRLSITYSGYVFNPINLIYKQNTISAADEVPVTYDWGDGTVDVIKKLIYSLDLRHNNYKISPAVQSLPNLAILDISNNQLTTAVLSNKNALNKLSAIDLSYNKISDIKVNSYDHSYSTLKKINMSHNNLVNVPDAVFDKIDDLLTLDLSHNYIEGLSQFTFEGIRNLLHLNLSHNRLSEINSSLFRFIELKDLSLSSNRIKELKITDFEKLNSLQFLDLNSNLIKTIDNNAFKNMFSLEILDLSYNSIEATSKDSLTNLMSLSSIDLSRNKLKYLPEGLFKNKTINNFSIGENFLEGSITRGMFEGVNVTTLDLSNQLLTGVEDYAFNLQYTLKILLLNNNAIQSLSNMCFRTLVGLQQLDLSNNKVLSLDFSKIDLTNLKTLLLRNNQLEHIKSEYFRDLNSLEYLDLSENAISGLEANSFNFLRNLINLQISANPLSETLETNTFNGLVSLPSLDISRTLLMTVKNSSFNDMNELKELNMSRSEIKELQYNAFLHTGYIETLDLSYNKLETLFLNMTDLVNLSTLLLNNNLLKTISPTSLQGLTRMYNISLAYNALENINKESFSSLTNLRYLDFSYNEKLNFTANLLEKCANLNTLNLSGIKTKINFGIIKDSTISEVFMSDAGIHNVSALNLNVLTQLRKLVLSNNNVSKLEIGALSGIGTLEKLDLSINNIFYIQPGAFKENHLLYSLNISHNSLSSIDYGIFRGLIHLNTLDMSYNNIKDLQNERFYELQSLSELIVDHNKIDSVNAEEFMGTSLSKLSIGDNPLPCRVLVNLKKKGVPFEITAITIDEHSSENIDGITCNKYRGYETPTIMYKDNDKNDLLVDLRNILYNISNKNTIQEYNHDAKYLENMTNSIVKANAMNNENLQNLAELSSKVIDLSNETNTLLNRILMTLKNNSIVTTSSIPFIVNNTLHPIEHKTLEPDENKTLKQIESNTLEPIENNTLDPIPYINKIKIELEKTISDEKRTILKELERKFSLMHYQTDSTSSPSNEKIVSTVSKNEGTGSLFTETCVALVLLILVGLVLYKFYKSRIIRRNRFSLSTRDLPGNMENSNL